MPTPNPKYHWKPGQSGNPSGRPKTKPITDRVRAILDDPVEVEKIAKQWLTSVREGNVVALKELLDRIEGRVTDDLAERLRVLEELYAKLTEQAGQSRIRSDPTGGNGST
jgi:hypothetical protein